MTTLGGSFSEAYGCYDGSFGNGGSSTGSDASDLADDLAAFQASQDAGAEGCRNNIIN